MEQLLTNYQFAVYIGKIAYGFTKVTNLVQEQEYDSIQEGGNPGPVFFRKARSKLDTLVLEKGVRGVGDPLVELLAVGMPVQAVVISIGSPENRYLWYSFDEGVVTKVELDNLDAMGNAVLIRKVEIAHSGLKRMDWVEYGKSKNKSI